MATSFKNVPFNGIGRSVAPTSLGKPTAAFPGAVAGDAQLAIAVDRFQTTLTVPLDTVMTSMTVASTAGITSWMLLSIESEIVQVTGSAAGNVVPIKRGFDGTTPAIHLASAAVAGLIDAYHHNTLAAEVEAIETALGPNLSKVSTPTILNSCAFNFAPQSPGGSLSAGAQIIPLNPMPVGLAAGGSLYISGGTGAAESVPITGVSGNSVIVNCANAHTGAWTIQSATGGIQEAVGALPATGGNIDVACNTTLNANVVSLGKSVVIQKLPGITITNNLFTILGCRVVYEQVSDAAHYSSNAITYAGPNSAVTVPLGTSRAPVATMNIYNSTQVNEDPSLGHGGFYVQTDFLGTTGTPGAINGTVNVPNCTDSNGATGVCGYCYLGWGGTSGTEGIGTHGQCDLHMGGGNVGVGLNAEGSLLEANPGGTPTLLGVVSNMGTGNVGDAVIQGIDVTMNANPISRNNTGGGMQMHADGVTAHAYGIRVYDNGGTFMLPLWIQSNQPTVSAVRIDNNTSGGAATQTRVDFVRSSEPIARIEAQHNAGDFGNAFLNVSTNTGNTLGLAFQISPGPVMIFHGPLYLVPVPVASLPAASVAFHGYIATVSDSSVNTWGTPVVGGGSYCVGVMCNGTTWNVFSK